MASDSHSVGGFSGHDGLTEALTRLLIEEIVREPVEDIPEDLSLIDSGLIDSLGLLNLVDRFEEEFGVEVGDDDLVPENFETIAAMTEYVRSRSVGRGGS